LRAALASLAVLSAGALGPVCGSGGIHVTNPPPEPVLVDTHGEVDSGGVDALVAEVEQQRGLGFIQRPTLELVADGDPRLAPLRDAARALEACPVADVQPSLPRGGCFPDPSLEWIVCAAPPDLGDARRALRRLLDAQNYPALARAAPVLRGDPGVAVRSLLAASANGASGRRGPPPDPKLPDLFDLPAIQVESQGAPAEGCVAIAENFLSLQNDPEAPFRSPPLSTEQLVSPRRYWAGEKPRVLVGGPPRVGDCERVGDESVGVARLLVTLLAKGGSVPGPVLGAWQGDRGVRFACADGRAPWIYVAELSDAPRAARFAAEIQRLLPGEFAGPSEARALGRRVVVASGGLSQSITDWATALASQPLSGLPGID